MALELYQTSKNSRLYREELPDGTRRGYVTCTLSPMHYESQPDSGVFDTKVDMTLERVNNARLNGYRMTGDGWHYAVQTEPSARRQPEAGTVGFGGRQGQNWFRFRLSNVGFIHWPSKTMTGVGGAPDYSAEPQITQTTRNIATHPELPDDIQVSASRMEWPNIWTTPGGGEISVRWVLKAGKLKEDIVVNQAAREWLQAQAPTQDDTYLGFRFEIDTTDIPRAYINGSLKDFADFSDDDGGVELTDDQDRLLAFMPLDYVYVTNRGGKRPLRKRFYRSRGRTFLFVGLSLSDLSGLLPGDLVFDPSMTQEAIAATADDCVEGSGTNDTTPAYSSTIFCGTNYGSAYWGGFRFTPNLPQGASLTGGGSEYASLRLYGSRIAGYRLAGTPPLICEGDDTDNAGAWADGTGAERPTGSGFTATTANTTFEVTTDPGSNGQFMGSGGIDIASIVEEIVGRAGWSANNGMRFRVGPDSTPNGEYIGVADFDDSNTEARMDAFYTTGGGGGGGSANLLSLLGVG